MSEPTGSLRWGRREGLVLLSILVLAWVLWGWGVGRADVYGSMEARRAVVAQQMLRTGDFVVPRVGSSIYLQKPPLYPWLVALVSAPQGTVTAASVRIVAGFAAAGIACLLAFGLVRHLGRTTALVSAGAFALMPIVFSESTVGHLNTLLAFAVTLSLFAAFEITERMGPPWRAAVICGLGIGMGLLTKGPLGLLFLVPTLLLYGVFRDGAPSRQRAALLVAAGASMALAQLLAGHLGAGTGVLYALGFLCLAAFGWRGFPRHVGAWALAGAIGVAMCVPWLVALLDEIGFQEAIDPASSEVWDKRVTTIGRSNKKNIFFYLWNFPVLTLLASVPAALAFLPASRASGERERFLVFVRCWALGSLLLFTVVSAAKSERYLVPAAPAVAILAADLLVRAYRGDLAPGFARRTLDRLRFPSARSGVFRAVVMILLLSVGAKAFFVFGPPTDRINRKSPRPTAERLRAAVPDGGALLAWGPVRASILFYLRADVWSADVDLRRPAYVCTPEAAREYLPVPAGAGVVEISRETYRHRTMVLLEVRRR